MSTISIDRMKATARGVARLVKKGKSVMVESWELLSDDRFAQAGVIIIVVFAFMGVFGPMLAPYDPGELNRGDDGSVLRTAPPSSDHWLGTTNLGRDVLSQLLVSVRTSLIVGLFAAIIATLIGTNIALLAGYYGGTIDELAMRLVDIAYGMPFLPFVIVLVFIFGTSIFNVILVIALIMWRASARVIRSEVLSQKERPYVESARSIGASDFRIIYLHILPNVLPLMVLYAAFGVAWAVIYEASLAFLGFGDPDLYSWGQMLFRAYNTGAIRFAWWWVLPPGIAIMLLVMSVFFIGRSLEKITNPELEN